MIKSNQHVFNILLVLCDVIAISLSLLFAWYIRFASPLFIDGIRTINFRAYMTYLFFILPIYIIIFLCAGLYRPYRKQRFYKEFQELISANFIGLFIFMAILYTTKSTHFSRIMLGLFYISSVTFTSVERGSIRKLLRLLRSKGFNLKHIIIVGAGKIGQTFADKVQGDGQLGYHICGFVDDYYSKPEKDGIKILGRTKDLNAILEDYRIDELIIALPNSSFQRINQIIDLCEYQGIKTQIIPDYFNLIHGRKAVFEELDGIPLINTRYIPLDKGANKFIKRLSDLVLSTFIFIVLSPLLLVTALLVKITSPGPIIYKQIRLGLNRKEFEIYKFRSMRTLSSKESNTGWTTENDPRKTTFGSFIRKTSIDELPQLINVIKGDMSLIGPRPERPFYVKKFKDEVPNYMIKHHVRPGLTGLAQVKGWRGDTEITPRIKCDIEYIEQWTIWMDIQIFFKTFLTMFKTGY